MAMVSITKDGTALLPWQLDGAPTNDDIEHVAGTLRALLDQNKPGVVKRARVSFSQSAGDSALELGCWMQAILPKLSPLEEVVLEFIEVPKDINAMFGTPLSEMPTVKVRVTRKGIDTLE